MPIEPLVTTGGRKLIPDPNKLGSFIADPSQISPLSIPNASPYVTSPLMTTGGRGLVPNPTRPGEFIADPNQAIQQPLTQSTQIQTSVQEPDLTQTTALSRQQTIRNYIDTYRQLHQELGIANIKDQFDNLQKKYTDLQGELQNKIAEINENPWLSEGSRQRKVKSLQDKYLARTDTLTNQLKLYESLYNQGLSEVEAAARDISSQFRVEEQEQLRLQELAQQRALAEEKLTQQREIETERNALRQQVEEERLTQQKELQEERFGRPIKVSPGETLYDPLSGKPIYTAPKIRPSSPTVDKTEDTILNRLEKTRGADGFIDPKNYLNERSKYRKSSNDFDKRYGYLLSPKEQQRLHISGAPKKEKVITEDFFIKMGQKEKDSKNFMMAVQAYRDAGFDDDEIIKLMSRRR